MTLEDSILTIKGTLYAHTIKEWVTHPTNLLFFTCFSNKKDNVSKSIVSNPKLSNEEYHEHLMLMYRNQAHSISSKACISPTCELICVKQFLQELNYSINENVLCNKTTLHIASNPMFHDRSKHIEINCHFI